MLFIMIRNGPISDVSLSGRNRSGGRNDRWGGGNTYRLDFPAHLPPRRVLLEISDLGPGRAWMIDKSLFWSPIGRFSGCDLDTSGQEMALELVRRI